MKIKMNKKGDVDDIVKILVWVVFFILLMAGVIALVNKFI